MPDTLSISIAVMVSSIVNETFDHVPSIYPERLSLYHFDDTEDITRRLTVTAVAVCQAALSFENVALSFENASSFR